METNNNFWLVIEYDHINNPFLMGWKTKQKHGLMYKISYKNNG